MPAHTVWAMVRQAPPCDLDPFEFNLHTAWWGPPNEFSSPNGWRASHHGVGGDEKALRRCGCGPCMEMAEYWRQSFEQAARYGPAALARRPPAEPVERTVPVGPVMKHLRQLAASGMSHTEIARAAGLDRSTLYRCRRADVKRVAESTASALLAVKAPLRAVS